METVVREMLLFGCMLITISIYTLTAVAIVVFRRAVCAIHKTVFNFDQYTASLSIRKYLANYNLLITKH